MVQFGGDTTEEADRRAHAMLDALGETEHDPDVAFIDDPTREDELWQVREAGLGATAHVPDRPDTWEGWEDSAVPVDRLGDYLRDLRGALRGVRLRLATSGPASTATSVRAACTPGSRSTSTPPRASRRTAASWSAPPTSSSSYGGSLSGEHGDGQTRGELLPRMFGDEVVGLFERGQGALRPRGPDEPRQGRRTRHRWTSTCGSAAHWAPRDLTPLYFAYPDDGGLVRGRPPTAASGVGKCRKHENDGGTVMCPSYQVTREEEHSTRGRARLLFEMLDGHGDGTVTDGWRSDGGPGRPRPVPGLQGLQDRLPGQRRHGHVQGGVPRPPLPAPAAPARRLRHGLAARGRRARGPDRGPATASTPSTSPPARGAGSHPGRRPRGPRPIPRVRAGDPPAVVAPRGRAAADAAPAGHARHGAALAGHVHQPLPSRRSAGPRSRCSRRPAGRSSCPTRAAVLRADLDLHRPARRRPTRPAPDHRAGSRRTSAPAVSSSGSSPAAPRSSAPTCTELFPDDQDVHRLRDHTVTLAELLTEHTDGWAPPRASYDVHGRSPRCTATSTRSWSGTPTATCSSGPASTSSGSTPAAAAWPATSASRPGTATSAAACAEQTLLPAAARGRRRHRRARRRVLAAAPRSTSSTAAAGRACTSPSSWPTCCGPSQDRHIPIPRRNTMSTTVADHLLERLREWGVEQVFGYPGDGINGLLGAFSRADDQPRFIQARHEEMAAFEAVGYAKFGGRAGVCMATSGPGRHPPAQRPVRRQARPRPGGRDRRPDQPHRDGRQLPAGGRPAQPVQGRRQRLRADGDGPRAAAQRARPGDPDRDEPARADGDHHPERRAGAGVRAAHARVQDGAVEPRASSWPTVDADDAAVRRGRRHPQRRLARSRCWSGRVRAARPTRSRRSPTCSAPASPRRCSARTCSPTSCRS